MKNVLAKLYRSSYARANRIGMRHRRLLILVVIALAISLSIAGSFLLRFDFEIPEEQLPLLQYALLIMLPAKLAIFFKFRLHRGWWTPPGLVDLVRIGAAGAGASLITTVLIVFLLGASFPRSIYVIDFLMCTALISVLRAMPKIQRELPRRAAQGKHKPVLIYGAGWAGTHLLREIWATPQLKRRVVGFLDDSPRHQNETLFGVRVLGRGRDSVAIVERLKRRNIHVEEILIAMPSASTRQMHEAIANCRAAGVPCKTLPGLGDLLGSKQLSAQIRDLSVEDLLCREQVNLDEDQIRDSIAGRVVLVSGAAGSIGSELSRQVALFGPKTLILVDRAESDLFRIDLELKAAHGTLHLVPEVADITDFERVHELIKIYKVDSIFHAAAYKHVPMMEKHPLEAACNNAWGTWNLARAAHQEGVKTFVLISTDKAVNPTNIMGLTKRIAEMIVSSFPQAVRGSSTRFVSVRFGNVLASNGSVVPVFQQQIAAGGPVTVTHPEVRRYFMTIREAVQLVLQASTMAKGSEVFILDMGQPVKIVELAKNMIRLAGLEPDVDIEIRFVGLRPGEKLYEELMTAGEHILPTHHQKISIFKAPAVRADSMEEWIFRLRMLLDTRDETGVVAHMAQIVPDYQMSSRWKNLVQERARISSDLSGSGRTEYQAV
jgi:FlaA1/EpsC-like NDP-sugar epimerase